MSILAVIPARGGSKGIPRKNLMPVAGKPLITWSIEQALAVDALDVTVSTEDAEIAEVSRKAGARIIARPVELAQDSTPTEPVIVHALDDFRKRNGYDPDAVMLLQATSPVRLPGTLARIVEEFKQSAADSMVGVVPCPPFLWAQEGTCALPLWDFEHRQRRQDMKAADLRYRETGSVYLTKPWVYRQLNNRLGGAMRLFVMDESEGIDIDTLHDLGLAEAALQRSR